MLTHVTDTLYSHIPATRKTRLGLVYSPMLVPRLDSAISSTFSQAGVVEHQRKRAPLDKGQEGEFDLGKMRPGTKHLGFAEIVWIHSPSLNILSSTEPHAPLSPPLSNLPLLAPVFLPPLGETPLSSLNLYPKY